MRNGVHLSIVELNDGNIVFDGGNQGDLDEICALAKELKLAVYLGLIERPKNRGGHSLYCSLVYINETRRLV